MSVEVVGWQSVLADPECILEELLDFLLATDSDFASDWRTSACAEIAVGLSSQGAHGLHASEDLEDPFGEL